ncbi:MAG: hypothetical protein M3276_03955 [Actinomycetota bacterium]|nr:hypothetical protein [Actinomycetota bacterium]
MAVLMAGILAASALPAAAHPGHASCRPAGQFAAGLARALGAEFGAQASTLAQQGLADDFVAATHTAVCE